MIVAVFVEAFGPATVPVRTRVCGTEVVTVPTFQRPVLIWYVPWLVSASTSDTPAGSRSVTWTLVASFGPLLLSVTVYVTVSPTFGVGLLTVLASARSACCGVTTALAVLFAALGSNWSAWLIVAVFVDGFGLATVATMTSVWAVERSRFPIVQVPVPEL